MKAIDHIKQNRPVHLAMRDVYYEQAAGYLAATGHMDVRALDEKYYEKILFMLRTARQHGRFAARAEGKQGKDYQFSQFINLLVGNVKAVLSMLNLKHSVEVEDGFFFSFLEANHASVALQAEEYERRSNDIIRSVRKTLELAHDAYQELRQQNLEGFNEFERERYSKAAGHYRQLAEAHQELPEYKARLGFFA